MLSLDVGITAVVLSIVVPVVLGDGGDDGRAGDRVSRVLMMGPLAAFADANVFELGRRGYTPLSTVNELLQMAQLSRWLKARGLAAGDLTGRRVEDGCRVEEFLAWQRACETNARGAMMAGMKRGEDEAEFYREIARRAKRVRERAAESLRLSRRLRKRQGNVEGPPDAAPRSRRRD